MDVNFRQMLTRPRVFPLHHNGRGRVNTLKGYNITNRDFMGVGLKKPGEQRRGKEAGEGSGGGGVPKVKFVLQLM